MQVQPSTGGYTPMLIILNIADHVLLIAATECADSAAAECGGMVNTSFAAFLHVYDAGEPVLLACSTIQLYLCRLWWLQ